ncbi:MAG: efflux RND transporter periplasmic adaptor subunit [Candidatus Eisenbacteria bacterium]|nr:efflux RND transporter periplasmic adaptor subunit [Candidatus Eisenbacteria bacterium]
MIARYRVGKRAGLAIGMCVLAVGGVLSGCGAPDGASDTEVRSEGLGTGTGGGRASSETRESDVCAEHGVLEAVCTICNPALAVVFQSKGDWCVEHSLPESFCPICHPETGGRPGNAITVDDAPRHGLRVRLESPEIATRSGFEVERAEPPSEGLLVVATAKLVPDNSATASVGPRTEGILEEYRVRQGQQVRKGDVLAALESAEIADARGDLRSARTRMGVARDQVAREQRLHDQGVSPLRTLQLAQQELAEAEAEAEMAASVLRMIGAAESGANGRFEIRAPIDGVVVERLGSVGEMLRADEAIFQILDPSVLWADIDVPELHASGVREGQSVELEVDGVGDRIFRGRIDYVAPVVDPRTRTVRARAVIENRDGALRANTYARVRIVVPADQSGVLIPRNAVQDTRGVQLVFVPVGPGEYETRRVRTAVSDGERLPVLSGIDAGEEVVTTGSFLLMTETLKGAIGAGCCEPAPGDL